MRRTTRWDHAQESFPSAQARADSTVVRVKPKHGCPEAPCRPSRASHRFAGQRAIGRIFHMRKGWLMRMRLLLACCSLGCALVMAADFEVKGPDGRSILLKDDGTWRYITDKDAPKSGEAPGKAEKPKVAGEAVLSLERRVQVSGGCLFGLRLVNRFPHIIQSFFPTFSALRANDVVYDSLSAGFQAL